MKYFKFLLLLFITLAGLSSLNEAKAQQVDISFSNFQDGLSPYGRWVNTPRFGQVWIYSEPGFRPYYSDGHWEYSNYGWEWVSDFDWGWAPFHYGRWEYDPFYGWMWIPGYEWAPAWVSWSSYDGYYGWAPLGYGLGINVSFGSIPYDRWTFIPRQNICDRDIRRYYVSPERDYGFRNAVVINNIYAGNGREGRFFRGPDRDEAERYTHNRIEERKVDYNERFGNRMGNNGNRGNWNNNNNNNNGNWNRDNNNGQGRRNNNDNNVNTPGRPQTGYGNPNRDNNNNGNNFPGNRQGRDEFPQRPQQVERPSTPVYNGNNGQRQGNFPRPPQQTERPSNNGNNGQSPDIFSRRQPQNQAPAQTQTVFDRRRDNNNNNNDRGNQRGNDGQNHGFGRRGN